MEREHRQIMVEELIPLNRVTKGVATLSAQLSASPRKRAFFAADPYYLEGWASTVDTFGKSIDQFVSLYASLVVKPDALIAGKLDQILAWLEEHRLTIVGIRRFRFNRHSIRAMWRYQWNAVTQEHKDFMDLMLPSLDSVLLLLRFEASGKIPGTVRLARMKGPADPAKSQPHHLRFALGRDHLLLNFIHSPDEPADLIRELGILLSEDDRRDLLEEARSEREDPLVFDSLRDLHELPTADLRILSVIRVMAARLPHHARDPISAQPDFGALQEELEGEHLADPTRVLQLCERLDFPLGLWERLVLWANGLTSTVSDLDSVLPSVHSVGWPEDV